jgi:DDE superfamily endonuclease
MPGSRSTRRRDGLDWRDTSTAAIVGAGFEQDAQRTRRQAVEQRLRQPPGEAARAEIGLAAGSPAPTRWTLRAVRASAPGVATYSLSGLWRLLRRGGLRLRQVADRLYSPDPDYLPKVARLEHCLREAARRPKEVVVLFLDEMGYTRWPEPAPDWMLAAPASPRRVHKAGPTNRQQRIIGALNALSGQVDYLDNYLVGREQVGAFYRQLDQVYARAQRVYVVQDNWSIHHHADVQRVLHEVPRLEPLWLPTYAPWLNPIEKLWRWLRRDVLKAHRLADDWQQLRLQVNAFLDQFAHGSPALLRYVGLIGDGHLAYVLSSP